jgi:uncharacterized protein (UPF0332 family)
VAAEWARARKLRDEARRELDVGLLDRGVSTLYFAALHACRAMLATRGIEPRSHRGMRSVVSLHFVKSGLVAADFARHLARLQDYREGADYLTTFSVTPAEADELASACDAVLRDCERVLATAPDAPAGS